LILVLISQYSKFQNILALQDFNYTFISSNDTQNQSSVFTIPNDCLLVRVRFWYAGNTDPQFGYLNFFKNLPSRYIQTLIYYDKNDHNESKVTVDLNWNTKKVAFAAMALPNQYCYVGVQYYK